MTQIIRALATALHLDDKCGFKLTDIMSLVKHHHRALGQLLGYQVGDLRVQQVMVAVHHDVSVQDLRGGQRSKESDILASRIQGTETTLSHRRQQMKTP